MTKSINFQIERIGFKTMKAAVAGMILGVLVMSPLFAEPTEKSGAPPAELATAITALKGHIQGTTELSAKEIDGFRKEITANKARAGKDHGVLDSFIDLVKTYEEEKGPLWVEYKGLITKKRPDGYDIHWAIFRVMQHVFDEVYTSEGLERFGEKLAGIKFRCSEYFPGKVDPPKDPNAVYTVKINGSYPDTWGAPIFPGNVFIRLR